MSAPDVSQQQAARNLIEQMVANSDVYGDDEAELERQRGGDEQQHQDDEDQQLDQDPDQDYDESQDAELSARHAAQFSSKQPVDIDSYSNARPAAGGQHRDQVQAAFENYGQITEEILNEWKEMFSLFDFDNTGFIKTDDLGTVLRGLGRNLTEAVIGTFINSYDANGSGKIDFPTFYRLLIEESPLPGPCHEKQVLADFHVFDMYRDGLITVVDLVHLLRNLGEPLTRDDVDCLLAELYIDGDNKINIRDAVQHMFRTSAPNPE